MWLLGVLLGAPAGAGTLTGLVTRADDGALVALARVYVRGTNLFATTDSTGRYNFASIPGGVYGITCAAAGLVGRSTGGVDLFRNQTEDFALDPPAPDTRTVTGSVTCAGVPCAALVLARHGNHTLATGLAGPDGAFALPGLPAEAFEVMAVALGHLIDSAEVEVDAVGPLSLALVPAPRCTVTGVVGLSDNLLDLSGSAVTVFGQNPAISALSLTAGGYRLEGVPAGLLAIGASRQGYNGDTHTDLLVQGDQTFDFVLIRPGAAGGPRYTVTGQVLLAQEDGAPQTARGSRVALTLEDGTVFTAATADDGRYTLVAPAGAHHLGAAREGYVSQSRELALGSHTTVDFTLALDPGYDFGPGAIDEAQGCRTALGDGLLLAAILLLARRCRR